MPDRAVSPPIRLMLLSSAPGAVLPPSWPEECTSRSIALEARRGASPACMLNGTRLSVRVELDLSALASESAVVGQCSSGRPVDVGQ